LVIVKQINKNIGLCTSEKIGENWGKLGKALGKALGKIGENHRKPEEPEGLSVEWIHGQDICPDELYYNSVANKSDR